MGKQNNEFDDRIIKFYEYLEYRLELEKSIENQLLDDNTLEPIEIDYKIKKKQPIPSSL